ncbi:MAG: hypothetical protein IIY95_05145, partial [Firmicutes bacterium]|nr:hypothetical protein [Bacillota bacterium]
VRSHTALKNAGILTVQQLLDLKREELNAIRNLGAKSLAELEALRESYRGKAAAAKTEYTAEELKPLIMSAYEQPFRGLSWQEFRDAMTLSGTKVEGFTQFDKDLDKIVIGQIKQIDPHPDADKLIICQVDVGTETTLKEIVEELI